MEPLVWQVIMITSKWLKSLVNLLVAFSYFTDVENCTAPFAKFTKIFPVL